MGSHALDAGAGVSLLNPFKLKPLQYNPVVIVKYLPWITMKEAIYTEIDEKFNSRDLTVRQDHDMLG